MGPSSKHVQEEEIMRKGRSGSRRFWIVVKGDAVDRGGSGFRENAPRMESGSREKGCKREALMRGRRYDEIFVGVVVVVVWD